MITRLDLSEDLLNEAMEITHMESKRSVVELALKELILKSRKAESLNSLPTTNSSDDVVSFNRLNDLKGFNKQTLKTLDATDVGDDLVVCKDADEMFKNLGI